MKIKVLLIALCLIPSATIISKQKASNWNTTKAKKSNAPVDDKIESDIATEQKQLRNQYRSLLSQTKEIQKHVEQIIETLFPSLNADVNYAVKSLLEITSILNDKIDALSASTDLIAVEQQVLNQNAVLFFTDISQELLRIAEELKSIGGQESGVYDLLTIIMEYVMEINGLVSELLIQSYSMNSKIDILLYELITSSSTQ